MSLSPRDDEPDDHVRPGGPVDDAGTADGTAPDEPGDGVPDDAASPADPVDDLAAELAAWEAIVANYGERPRWEPPAAPAQPPGPVERRRPHPDHPAGRGRPTPAEEPDLARGPDERFVPPPPGPLPRTTPARFLAWLGLLAVPVAVLVLSLASVRLPMWGETLLIAWFVGGFAFLVASMRRHHDDPDDGAVL